MPGDLDRRAAEAMLSCGSVTIRVKGEERAVEPGKDLPTEAFQLTHVRLGDQPGFLTDAGLEPLEGLTELIEFSLGKGPRVTDSASLIYGNLPRLEALWLDGTCLTGAGLAHLDGLPAPGAWPARGTGVTDAGLEHIEHLPLLRLLALGRSVRNGLRARPPAGSDPLEVFGWR